jgi:hypothetical protein
MTTLMLDRSLDEARNLVIQALQMTEGITKIRGSGRQIVGKTGIQFPRVLWSYGENVYVDFSETSEGDQVRIDVWAEKSVWMNVPANPEKYKRRFLGQLDYMRNANDTEIADFQHQQIPQPQTRRSKWGLVGRALLGVFVPMLFAILVAAGQSDNTGSGTVGLIFVIGPIIGVAIAYYTWKN